MTLLFADSCFIRHDTGQHPESTERLRTVYRHLDDVGLPGRCLEQTVAPADLMQLLRVHSAEHVEHIRRFAEQGGGRIETDTVMCPESYDVALCAAGTAIRAVDCVLGDSNVDDSDAEGQRQAVCLIRPPGHHALPATAMGFCLFNNVAIAARQALAVHELSRVLIVDWDVHHGNGTQDIFYEDESVYFFSVHRHPFYPGSGTADETGSGPGLGSTFNLPLSFGTSRREFLGQFQTVLQSAADRCRPELVLVSAGFDAHAADPIGSLGLESEDFCELTQMVADVAAQHCRGRLVSLLEGGYNVDALAESVQCHLETLLDQ